MIALIKGTLPGKCVSERGVGLFFLRRLTSRRSRLRICVERASRAADSTIGVLAVPLPVDWSKTSQWCICRVAAAAKRLRASWESRASCVFVVLLQNNSHGRTALIPWPI
jgi:hypothetical protein